MFPRLPWPLVIQKPVLTVTLKKWWNQLASNEGLKPRFHLGFLEMPIAMCGLFDEKTNKHIPTSCCFPCLVGMSTL